MGEPVSKLHVGWSARKSMGAAVRAAVGQALEKASSPAMALVFSAGNWDRSALACALAAELGCVPWIGGTATAIFANDKVIDDGLAVGVLDASSAYVGVGVAGGAGISPFESGGEAVSHALEVIPPLKPDADLARSGRVVFLLVDSFLGTGNAIVQGAVREGGTGLNWVGCGIGGLGRKTGRMSVFVNGKSLLDTTAALALELPAPIGSSMANGFKPFGPALSVTKVGIDNLSVQELDYMPAIEVFERVAREFHPGVADASGVDVNALAQRYPVGIPQADGNVIIREIIRRSDAGNLDFIASVYEGSIVRLHSASERSLVESARMATANACSQVCGRAGGLVVFDCDGRHAKIGCKAEAELKAILEEAGEGVELLGCTAYGEVGRLGAGYPQFHNESIVVTAFPGEKVEVAS